MAITDIFKKEDGKKAKPRKQVEETKVAAVGKKSAAVKPASKTGREALVLEHAHITEKASNLAEINQYVFKVAVNANKQEISRAVESYYGVSVIGVNVVNVPGRRRRRARGIFMEPGYRKAIVTVKKGQSIEVLPK